MRFEDFARAHGLIIDNLYPSQRIQRCSTTDHPHKKNGAFSWDGMRGFIYDWAGEAKAIWFNDPTQQPLTDEQKRAYIAQKLGNKAEIEKRYKNAAIAAQMLLRDAEVKEHQYLIYKGFEADKGFVNGNELLIPMRNVLTNELQTLQRIYWIAEERRYEKKMLSGGRAKGAVYILGNSKAQETILVEGYATGLSVKKAADSVGLKLAVIVCFSDSNMVHVAQQLKKKSYIFADNDASNAGEKAVIKANLPYVMSDEIGQDANDLMLSKGVFSVAKKIMELRQK
jgi:phage/plasmid primase-like uncharacterized protein